MGNRVQQTLPTSAGGKVAMNAALRFPARVERLTVVDIAPVTQAPRKPVQQLYRVLGRRHTRRI
jgi:pimeloyl-ACP methyl ester carboxylesterase